MRIRPASLPRFLVLVAAFDLVAGCPGKDEGDPTGASTETSAGTTADATDTGSTSVAPTTGAVETTGAMDTTGDATTGGTTLEATTGDLDEVCACISPGEFGADSYTCGSGACGLVHPDCVDSGDTDTDGLDCEMEIDEEQVDCALDLLIAGEGGVVKWSYSPDFGFSASGGFVELLPGRQGLLRTWSLVDLGGEDSAAGVVPLRSADYFAGCKQMSGPAKYGCMIDVSEQEPAAQCDEPGFYEDF